MKSPEGSHSLPAGNHLCSTPQRAGIQSGRNQASPFTIFAADLSPITPASNSEFNHDWQPPVGTPTVGVLGAEGDGAGHSPGSCKKKTTEVSKEESSLRSSYDTDNTNFNGVHSRNARSSPAQQIAQASGSNAPKSKANAAFSAGSTALKAPILRSQEGKPLSQPQDCKANSSTPMDGCNGLQTLATVSQSQEICPRTLYPAMACMEASQGCGEEGLDGSGSKRKTLEAEGEQRQRRRTLNFNATSTSTSELSQKSPKLPENSCQSTAMPAERLSDAFNAVSTALPAPAVTPQLSAPFPLGLQSQAGVHMSQAQRQMPSALHAAMAAAPLRAPSDSGVYAAAIAAATAVPSAQWRGGARGKLGGKTDKTGSSTDKDSKSGQKRCNCKKSRCLKLYCDCFAAGQFCHNCTCTACSNTAECGDAVMETRTSIKQRNAQAFETKVISQHKKGCHCKKSNCKKKYCECFQAGVNCGSQCKCENCQNQPGDGPPEIRPSLSRIKTESRSASGESIATEADAVRRTVRAKTRRTPVKEEQGTAAGPGPLPTIGPSGHSLPLAPHLAHTSAALESKPAAPFSPAMVWNDQHIFPGNGATFLHQKDLQAGPFMEASIASLSKPTPIRSSTGFPNLSVMPEVKDKPSLLGLPALPRLKTAESLGDLLRQREDSHLMPMPDPLGNAQAGPADVDMLEHFGGEGSMGPLMSLAGHVSQAGFAEDLHTDIPDFDFPALNIYSRHQHRLGPHPASRPQDACFQVEGPLEATAWTEKRLDDIEIGEGPQGNLESLIMGSCLDPSNLEELLSPQIDLDELEQDENIAPFHNKASSGEGQLEGSMLSARDLKQSHASSKSTMEYLFGSPAKISSPARLPLGQQAQNVEGRGLGEGGQVRAQAMRRHSAAPPSLPRPAPGRDTSTASLFQDEIDESMTSELFEDAFPGAGHPSVARKDCGLALKHAHSLPGLSNTQDNKRKALSPVGRTYSGALQAFSHKGTEGLTSMASSAGQHPFWNTLRQGHRNSPKKGRVIRSSASLSGGSGFTRLTSGLTTIVSPPKLR